MTIIVYPSDTQNNIRAMYYLLFLAVNGLQWALLCIIAVIAYGNTAQTLIVVSLGTLFVFSTTTIMIDLLGTNRVRERRIDRYLSKRVD